ncbi:MAG: hypothetical protein Fur0021_15440 [Candidatus Promineifilaceae bacterium]
MDIKQNPYHEHKLLHPYHLKRAKSIIRGEVPVPSTIEIDVTDEACNQACIHCCFNSNPTRKLVSIDLELLLSFLNEAYDFGTYAFELVGGGEPTNHRQIAEIIDGISSLSKSEKEPPHISLVTNGVRLERVFPVIEKLEWIRISMDTCDELVYNKLHGVHAKQNHFQKVIRNLEKALTLIEPERIRLGYLVVPPLNHQPDQIDKMIDWASTLGVKHVAFRPAFLGYKTSSEDWKAAADAINKAKQKYRPGFVLGGVGGSWEYAIGRKNQPSGNCRTRPLVLVIKADGTIPSCILFRERLDERPPIGHISQGFTKIWFSEEHMKSIRRVDRSICPSICKHFRADDALVLLENAIISGQDIPIFKSDETDNPYFI